MTHDRALRLGNQRQRLRHQGIECLRTLRTADHQHPRCTGLRHAPRQRREAATHRIADGLGTGGEGVRKGLQYRRRDARQPAIGEARRCVLLVDHQRDALEPRGQATRPGREAAHAEHHRRPHAAEHRQRVEQAAREQQRRHQQLRDALAAQARDAHELDREAGLGHALRLEGVRRAHPGDRMAQFLQTRGDGQRGEDVTAGTAGHDEDVHDGRPWRDFAPLS